jgi:hypothetical protein
LDQPTDNPFQSPSEDSGYGSAASGRGGNADDSSLGIGDWILAALCGGIACILGIVWMVQGKPKGVKMIGISLMFALFWNIVRFSIAVLSEQLR